MTTLFAEVDSKQFSNVAGQIFVAVLMLAGIIKCWQLFRRPTTNSKCALSLGLMLTSLLVLVLLPHSPGKPSPFTPVSFLIGMISFLVAGAAGVLAVLGLVECAKDKDRYLQGRSQAFLTLFLGLCLSIPVVTGAWRAANANRLTLPSQPTPG
ncbi:MAG: hypothetical protein EBS05_22775 [Proteobacteria bacterium]|nr:hypothetical protein [Pseudomonadota bacterium]